MVCGRADQGDRCTGIHLHVDLSVVEAERDNYGSRFLVGDGE